MQTRTIAPLIALIAILGGACVPIPVAAPPAKIGLGGGAAFGDLTDQNRGEATGTAPAFNGSLGIHPLQYVPQAGGIDAGVGVIFELIPDAELAADPLLGGYLEVGYPLWTGDDLIPTKENPSPSQGRLYLIGRGDLLSNIGDGGRTGVGLGIGLGLELITLHEPTPTVDIQADEDGDVSTFIGYIFGEAGIGLELTANTRQVGPQSYNTVLLRLIFRTPTTLGILLVPLSDDDDKKK